MFIILIMKVYIGNVVQTQQSFFGWLYDLFSAVKPPISLRSLMLASGFFMGATCIRWLFKSNQVNEFNTNDKDKMLKICKFCQIREEAL